MNIAASFRFLLRNEGCGPLLRTIGFCTFVTWLEVSNTNSGCSETKLFLEYFRKSPKSQWSTLPFMEKVLTLNLQWPFSLILSCSNPPRCSPIYVGWKTNVACSLIPSKRYERISAYLIYVKILEPFLTPNYHPFKPYQVPECTLLLPKETTLGLFTGKSFFHRPKKPVRFVGLIWFTDLIFPSFLAPLIEALSPP